MENKSIIFKITKVLLLSITVFSTFFLIWKSIHFFKENSKLGSFKEINLKILRNNQSKSLNPDADKQIEIENFEKNLTDTISLEKFIPDKTKRMEMINETPIEQSVKIIMIEETDGDVMLENVNYKSYTENEFLEVKTESKSKYIRSLGLTTLILVTTFSLNGITNRIFNKKSKNKKKPNKKKK